MASLGLKITAQAFPQKPQDRLKAVLRSHGLKWPKFYFSPMLSQWKEEILQHCWRNLLFGTNTQHLIPWPILEKDGTHCATKRSPMWPRPSEQNYQLSLSTCKPSLHCIHKTVHSDSSVLPCSPDRFTEAVCNFFQLSASPSKSKAPPQPSFPKAFWLAEGKGKISPETKGKNTCEV